MGDPVEHSSRPKGRRVSSTQPTLSPDHVDSEATHDLHHTAPVPQTRPLPPANPRPLIDHVTNQWQDEKAALAEKERDDEPQCCDLSSDSSVPSLVLHSRRFRRMLALLLLTFLALTFLWKRYISPRLQASSSSTLLSSGFLHQPNGSYGLARGGGSDGDTYADLTQILDLDPSLLPGGVSDPQARRRLVFVGDVHGCRAELEELLATLGFSRETDHLVLTGDVVAKGPDSRGVLDLLIGLGATSVRGNHEDRLLAAAPGLLADRGDPGEEVGSLGARKDRKLLRGLKRRHLRYLRDMPLILRIPALPRARGREALKEGVLVVHAGLVPGVPLMRQDPYYVMNMRSIHYKSHVPSAEKVRHGGRGGMIPWVELWGWYNRRLAEGKSVRGFHWFQEEEEQVGGSWWERWWEEMRRGWKRGPSPWVAVYGHDAGKGLVLKTWSKGLDSGCVKGGRLTAMVVGASGNLEYFQVWCKNYLE